MTKKLLLFILCSLTASFCFATNPNSFIIAKIKDLNSYSPKIIFNSKTMNKSLIYNQPVYFQSFPENSQGSVYYVNEVDCVKENQGLLLSLQKTSGPMPLIKEFTSENVVDKEGNSMYNNFCPQI